ncbi:uncharacterized protein G6M90_00g081920 [Metarhizium brunneum]|uniref:SRR1-like domain-containing protein n=1 Tax=Metarhizium brunneum TaxID=500148 RepID=A0A7D5YXA4_9HYPO
MPAADAQEWTFPKPKKTRRRPPPPPAPQRTAPAMSASAIRAEHLSAKRDWASSTCCTSLRELVASHGPALSPVTSAVCLGLGTFDPHDGSCESKRRTHRQFIAFLTMVEELEKLAGTKIECIFQEPLFTDAERTFLTGMGYRVVDHPVACRAVTADSLLYGVHLYRELYEEALRAALPAVFVGTDWDTWDGVLLEREAVQGVRRMHERYERFAFPEDGITFSSTSVYWRPRGALASSKGGGEEHGRAENELVDRLDKVDKNA